MCEFLISHGHQDGDLFDYSFDKLRLYYNLAKRRSAREQAQFDLRQMRCVQAAQASLIDKAGAHHYKQAERRLMEACSSESPKGQDVQANRASVAQRLLSMGAKRTYGRKH